MSKRKLFVATLRVAIDAKACRDTVDGACDWFSALLSENKDVFDWTHGSRKGSYPFPKAIEVENENYKEGDLFT